MKPQLALFDFDGTITRKDTLWEFLKFHAGKKFWLKAPAILPVLLQLKAGLIPADQAKMKVMMHFLSHSALQELEATAQEFTQHKLPNLIRPGALQEIDKHRQSGCRIMVVSASWELWVKPWCDLQGLACIATQLEVKAGKLTGHYLTPNCNGPEKVHRIKSVLDPADYQIVAYGDSLGDRPMLELANQAFFKPFRAE